MIRLRIDMCVVRLPDFDREALTVWIFGPGTGEFVAVRAPPDNWLLVDGCQIDGIRYPARFLSEYGARPSIVILSHPHQDHAFGVAEVVEQSTRGNRSEWPLLGAMPAPDTRGADDLWDYRAAFEGRVAEHAIATMFERWRQNPACQWVLDAGSSKALGEATVTVLSPTDSESKAARAAFVANDARYNYNRAASALLVRWRKRRVLLGSDLVEEPGGGWTAAHGWDGQLSQHDVYKLAHHTAIKAIAKQTAKPATPTLRTWIAAPFASKGLPKARDGEALHRLLGIEDRIELTGLPRRHEQQSGKAEELTRAQLRDDPDVVFADTTSGFPDCYVMLSIPETGPVRIERGPGSVRVRA